VTEISAGRLHLRPWQPGDAEAVFGACQDPEIQRWTAVPSPYRREDAVFFVRDTSPRQWESGEAAPFAVLDATTGQLLASVGINRFDRRHGLAEVGYWGVPEARGRGVVTQATAVVCRWCFETQDVTCIEWRATVGNEASRRVAEKVGFRYAGTLRAAARGDDAWIATLVPGDEPPGKDVLVDGEVRLRPWRPSEESSFAALVDPEVTRWTSIDATSAAEQLRGRVAGRWFGRLRAYAVEERGAVVGDAQLFQPTPDPACVVLGFLLGASARGRGLATRAGRLLVAEAARRGAKRIELGAEPGNRASLAVAARLGFTREGLARKLVKGRDIDVWSLVEGDRAWPGVR
jgi:RimJ/RimL family protein N-acetyltransferase